MHHLKGQKGFRVRATSEQGIKKKKLTGLQCMFFTARSEATRKTLGKIFIYMLFFLLTASLQMHINTIIIQRRTCLKTTREQDFSTRPTDIKVQFQFGHEDPPRSRLRCSATSTAKSSAAAQLGPACPLTFPSGCAAPLCRAPSSSAPGELPLSLFFLKSG